MKLVLFIFLLISNAYAHDLSKYRLIFERYVDDEQSPFELSTRTAGAHEPLLPFLSSEEGLESLVYNQLIDNEDFEIFLIDLFDTPYGVPHFCYNFLSFNAPDLWRDGDLSARKLCRRSLLKILEPIREGDYNLRTYILEGSNGEGNYKKARVQALDPQNDLQLIINFDLVLD